MESQTNSTNNMNNESRPLNNSSSTTTSYEIKWNNYSTVLQSVFSRLLVSHHFSDVTLACEGESIKCHRPLLAACSSYFEKLLCEHSESNLVIYMKDMKIWELRALVNFMYNGQVSVQESQLSSFIKAAESFNMNGLDLPTGGRRRGSNVGNDCSSDSTEIISCNKEATNIKSELSSSSPRIQSPAGSLSHRNKPTLSAQAGQHYHDQLKRKIMEGPPKLFKMQKTELKSNPSRSNGKLSSGHLNEADFIEHERAQLAQLLAHENENFEDVEEDMERAGVSDDGVDEEEEEEEDAGGDQDGDAQIDYANDDNSTNHALENGDDNDGDDGNDQQYEDGDGDENDGTEDMFEQDNNDEADLDVPDDDDDTVGGEQSGSDLDGDDMDNVDGSGMMGSDLTPRNRNARTYEPELQEAAFDALRNSVSIRQCAELFGIPRKTLAKWKNRGLHLQNASEVPRQNHKNLIDAGIRPVKKRGPAIGSTMGGPEGADRAQRLQKATSMALSGITVRQAAAHYDIPRTTLCAYMKRQGHASHRTPNLVNVQPVTTSVSSSQNYSAPRRIIGSTIVTMTRNRDVANHKNVLGLGHSSNSSGQNDTGAIAMEEFPFLGLSDFIEQME